MSEHTAAWRYGWRLGVLAGAFAALQVLVMVSAGHAAAAQIVSLQISFSNGSDASATFGPLLAMALATYLAALVSGAIMLRLSAFAGQLAGYTSARAAAGIRAGQWVALVSAGVWIGCSMIAVALTHADGTLTGMVTANPIGPLNALELAGVLVQEVLAALAGLGLAAIVGGRAGARGAADARAAQTAPGGIRGPLPGAPGVPFSPAGTLPSDGARALDATEGRSAQGTSHPPAGTEPHAMGG